MIFKSNLRLFGDFKSFTFNVIATYLLVSLPSYIAL